MVHHGWHGAAMSKVSVAKFNIGQIICHKVYAFRGVVFDVDPEFADSEIPYETIHLVEGRQRKDQPFYYLFAETDQTPYVAYVSEQNLAADISDEPVTHPQIEDIFERDANGSYRRRNITMN